MYSFLKRLNGTLPMIGISVLLITTVFLTGNFRFCRLSGTEPFRGAWVSFYFNLG